MIIILKGDLLDWLAELEVGWSTNGCLHAGEPENLVAAQFNKQET
jgi:hypothetical protein